LRQDSTGTKYPDDIIRQASYACSGCPEATISVEQRVFYASLNDDVWLLLREEGTADWLVRHQANAASGGHLTDLTVAAFLAQGEHGPEH
jgi:hypothetical protein